MADILRIGTTSKQKPLPFDQWKFYTVSGAPSQIKVLGVPGPDVRFHWRCSSSPGKCYGTGKTAQDQHGQHGPFVPLRPHCGDCNWNADTTVLEYYRAETYRRFKADTRCLIPLHAHHQWAIQQLQLHYPHLVGWFPAQWHFVSTASRYRCTNYPKVPTRLQLGGLYVPPGSLNAAPRFRVFPSVLGDRRGTHAAMSMMVWGTDVAFANLCAADEVFVDGTFKTCPAPFYQLFIIHHLEGERMIPGLYGFLTHKCSAQYIRLFRWLSQEATARGHPQHWDTIRMDFENGLMTSVAALRAPNIRAIFPAVFRIGCCFFHLCQSLYRMLCTMGFQSHYRHLGLDVHMTVKKTMALAFLDPIHMVATLAAIRQEYTNLPPLAAHIGIALRPNLNSWFDYVSANYVSDTALVARRAEWTVRHIDHRRTNNNLEGYHSKLASRISQFHPNLWHMVEFLMEDARETSAFVAQLAVGQQILRRSLTYEALNGRLMSLKQGYDAAPPVYTHLEYVTACAHAVHVF
jgi:hypothetical protein